MEDVHSERMEQNRLRRCHIYYFLEDDSMMVVEPSVSNSGIPHGKFDRSERTKQMEQILNFQVPAEGLDLVILLHTQY